MWNKIGALSACCVLAATLAPAPADAAVVIYSGSDPSASSLSTKPNSDAARAQYVAAVSGLPQTFLATFETGPLGAFSSYNLGGGATMTGVDQGNNQQVVRNQIQCQFSLCGGNTTVGGKTFLGINGGTVTFDFAAPIQAFGAYFTGAQLAGIQLTFNDGSARTVDIPGVFGADFVGFTDFGKSISKVTFNGTHDFMAIDDITFSLATPTGVPEPATWAMMISGFGLAGAALRRRRQVLTA